MCRLIQLAFVFLGIAALAFAGDKDLSVQRPFTVKYVDLKTIYIDGGKNAGLSPGMALIVKRSRIVSNSSGDVKARLIVAKITVVSVTSTSAMCDVRSQNTDVHRGDLAFLAEPEQHEPERTAQDLRSTVFKPALEEMDSEDEKRAPGPRTTSVEIPPAPLKSEASPMSIADAARANRDHPLRGDSSAASNSTSPAGNIAPTAASATSPEQTAASNEPLSLGEIARRNRRSAQSASGSSAATPTKPNPATTDAPVPSSAATRAQPAASAPKPSSPSPDVNTTVAAGNETATVIRKRNATPAPPATGTIAASTPAPTSAEVGKTAALPSNATSVPPAGNQTTPVTVTAGPIQASAPLTSNPAPSDSQTMPTGVSFPAAEPKLQPKSKAEVASIARPANPEIAPMAGMRVMSAASPTTAAPVKVDFRVKYVAEDAIYIEGGKDAGLAEGMSLTIARTEAGSPAPHNIAEVTVVSVSNSSSVCEIKDKSTDIQRGDIALLSQTDQQKIVDARTLSPNRKYPQVIAFSEGDPLDEEARESIPKPPSPEVNRARGRIGVDSSFISSRGSGTTATTMQTGGVVRVDMSRIAGSYWNLNGYWRGRLNLRSNSAQPQTVYDLVNRTYTIGLTYVNPNSRWTAGVGRLFLPWATSLDTIDGGYLGRKIGAHTIIGAFAGTTPDPASFDYNQDRRLAGAFVAVEAGSFDHVRFTSTEGVAVSAIEWREDRQFVFSENGLFYKRFLSIYHSAQADIQRLPTGGTTEGLSRSFATLRLQPWSHFSIDVNHNYFRDVPTFDPSLVGTGLLDKFLFQGVSVGGRLELPGHISIYNNVGQSSSSADAHASLNQLYGLTLGRLWKTGLRGDIRYSKFNSSFGAGNYRAASLSRNFSEVVRIEVNAGQQVFLSSLGVPTNYRLLGSTVDLNVGGHYFIESAFNLQRSTQQNFDQWLTTLGYRFDSGRHKQ
jgi:hypothetical protein